MSVTPGNVSALTPGLPGPRGADEPKCCRHPRTASRQQRAVLLLHLGMPAAPDRRAVRRFRAEVLSDPEVTRLPRGLKWSGPVLGRSLAWLHSTQRAEEHQKIWTGKDSPLAMIARQQASALESALPGGMPVFYAMRYGRPSIAETLRQVEARGIHAIVAVPMYPQHSATTTLTIVRELYRQVSRCGCNVDVAVRGLWFDDVGYINAQARLIHDYANARGLTPADTHLVYSLRSLPLSCIDRGDPYMDHIHRTAELVSRRLGWPEDRTSLGYQGPPGSVSRLQPAIPEVLAELSGAGEKQLLLCPLSYSTDCMETLGDVHVDYRRQFESDGGRFYVCPALNTFEPFIAALRNLVLHGRHPVSLQMSDEGLMTDRREVGVQTEDAEAYSLAKPPIESLVMVGMTLGGRLGPGQGPMVAHTSAEIFREVKKTQCEVPKMLRGVCSNEAIGEAWLWNTCRRFEFFGLLNGVADEAQLAGVVDDIRCQLFSPNGQADVPTLNILHGADAWHYLMRTAAGLNSGLPGEREILQQLQAAHRLAERAGTAGPLTNRLLIEVAQREAELREQTDWGRFHPDYCRASISQIATSIGLKLHDCRCVVLGGSTTSCGILEALAERFDVPRRRLTLLHRGHGPSGRLKMLRRAIGNGRRIRVHKYNERLVMDAIAGADVLFIGLDRKEPVLDAERIRECRDFQARPLVIFDFNMFGSTTGIENLNGVRLISAEELDDAAAAFAEEMCSSDRFAEAVEAAESWIRDHLPASETVEAASP